jgi:hypothetical protein
VVFCVKSGTENDIDLTCAIREQSERKMAKKIFFKMAILVRVDIKKLKYFVKCLKII